MTGSNASRDAAVEGPAWERVTESASWSPGDSAGEVVFKDAMWILGGWVGVNDPNPRDVWTSSDGIRWNCVQPKAPWLHSDLPIVYTFQGRIWIMGGHAYPLNNEIWALSLPETWTPHVR